MNDDFVNCPNGFKFSVLCGKAGERCAGLFNDTSPAARTPENQNPLKMSYTKACGHKDAT